MKEIFKLWENAPGVIEGEEIPSMTYYPSESKSCAAAVVIFPGGGYSRRADHEGRGYAEYLNANGIDAFVVDYRVSPYRFPYPLLDARRAVRFVRANADRFAIDPSKIAVMGSSAGGHLAALVSTYTAPIDGEGYDELDLVDFRPNAQILCYPVIDKFGHPGSYNNLLGERVAELCSLVNPALIADKSTPPAFIWHTAEDNAVDVCNTYRYATRLKEFSVPCEMHIFPFGHHGLGLAPAPQHRHLQQWASLMIKWLSLMGFCN